ncbi:MAG TPA: histidine phosphatase family protein [Candidatus Binatia bacterium]|nr:histidine phosphatase family protein [Candidatus Binatia bacterium]
MTRLLLIRHGETPWNRDRRWQGHADVSLSAEGLAQSTRLGVHLKAQRASIEVIYSSDLRRAHETARKLVEALAAELVIDPVWREIEVGRWTGLSQDEIRMRFAEEWGRIAAGEDLPRGGGETFAAFSLRIVEALDLLRHRHRGQTVAVVTHGGVIRAALLHALGLPWLRLREIAAVDNTALTELVWDGVSWTVGRRNHAPHLADLASEATG